MYDYFFSNDLFTVGRIKSPYDCPSIVRSVNCMNIRRRPSLGFSVITRLRLIAYKVSLKFKKKKKKEYSIVYIYSTGATGPPNAEAPPLANESKLPRDARPLSPE